MKTRTSFLLKNIVALFIDFDYFLVNFGPFRRFLKQSRNPTWRIQDGRRLRTWRNSYVIGSCCRPQREPFLDVLFALLVSLSYFNILGLFRITIFLCLRLHACYQTLNPLPSNVWLSGEKNNVEFICAKILNTWTCRKHWLHNSTQLNIIQRVG